MMLLILTTAPHDPLSHTAVALARALLAAGSALAVFFYQDAVSVANRLLWQPADRPNVQAEWQALAQAHALALPVCVSAALARGVSDADNAARHGLSGENLAAGFSLTGLGTLAELTAQAQKVIRL